MNAIIKLTYYEWTNEKFNRFYMNLFLFQDILYFSIPSN